MKDAAAKEKLMTLCQRIAELEDVETRQKRVEQALAETEKRYRSLFEDVPIGLYRTTPDGHILDANPAFIEILGYPDFKTLVSVNAADLYVDREDRKRWQAGRETEMNSPAFDVQMRCYDGTSIWARDSARAVRDEGGAVVCYEGSLEDVTERKLAVKSLRTSERQYRTLVEALREGLIMADAEENIIFANHAFCAILGYSKEEIYSMNMRDLVPVNDFQTIVQQTSKRKMGISSQYEITMVRKDGEARNILVSAAPQVDEEGTFQWAVAVFQDITEEKRAQEALRASEEKYRTLAENLNVGVYRNTPGPRGKFIEANQALVRLFGFESKDELWALDVADLYRNPADRKRLSEKLNRFGFVKDEEVELKTKAGTPIIASVCAVAVREEDGKIKYFDGVIEDITERKQAEELQQTFERLRITLDGTVHALAATAETTDPYTAGHQQRVAQLASAIARDIGLSDEQIEGVTVAGTLHDIGKIYVPASILSRPGKLSQIEFSLIKAHPVVGYNILKTVEFPWPIAEAVLQHHERLDGSGYPRGLRGDEILMEARILGVADVVEAMSSHRPYRPALGIDKALEEIERGGGTEYEPAVVDVCLRLFNEKGFEFDERPDVQSATSQPLRSQ
jgi:PAS domain S-box-containing protein/putative nucleotidyltransferase with HDIG domain